MNKKIEYAGIGCTVSTTDKTTVDTGGLPLDPHVVEYAAWRWLYRCQALQKPFCLLSLQFRLGKTRRKSMRLCVTLPASAAGLPGGGWLHLILVISSGVTIASVSRSDRRQVSGISRHIRRVVFH